VPLHFFFLALLLEQRINAALRAGVARWNIIVDPGIGFAKTPQQVAIV
jgi:dihydropteroate synthase